MNDSNNPQDLQIIGPDNAGTLPIIGENPLSEEVRKEMNENYERALKRFTPQSSPVVPRPESKMSDIGKLYSQRMAELNSAHTTSQIDSILQRINQQKQPKKRIQELRYEDANIIVDRIFELELAKKEKTISDDAETLRIIEAVTRYFIGDPTGPIPLTKGIFLYGAVGVGKTFLFEIMQDLCKFVPIESMRFEIISTKKLMESVSTAKSLAPINQYTKGGLLLDDLGEEKETVGVYRDDENPIDSLLSSRYYEYQRFGLVTHATSNLKPSEIKARYGSRIHDRIREMFEPVFFPGKSKRRETNEPDEPEETKPLTAESIFFPDKSKRS